MLRCRNLFVLSRTQGIKASLKVLHIQFSSLSRRSLKTYPNDESTLLTGNVRVLDKGVSNNQRNTVQSQKEFLVQCMKTNDYNSAMSLIDIFITNDDSVNIKAFHPLLCLCCKKEHIPRALNMLERLKKYKIYPSEQVFVALIRCYCDGGFVKDALHIIDVMLNASLVPKLRALHPILETVCVADDMPQVIFVMQFIQKLNIEFQPESLTLFLEAVGRNRLCLSFEQHQSVDALLQHVGDKLLGLSLRDMHRVAGSFEGLSALQVQQRGVLVETLDDVRGAIVDDSALRVDGSVLAVDISYDGSVSHVVRALPRLTNVDPSIPIGQQGDQQGEGEGEVELREPAPPQMFVVRSEQSRLSVAEGGQVSQASAARIVHISTNQCRCPNCQSLLLRTVVSEEDRVTVRTALRGATKQIGAQLDAFSTWLSRQEEFDFIVDAANVAYHGQNHKSGRFSFQQIQLVVDTLRTRGRRILVVIPQCYTQAVVPNSIRTVSRRDVVSDADHAVLQGLRDRNMLYVVPNGSNDDWFWLYATLYRGRCSPALVVTNDLMRDHKVAFPEARTFMRWRTSHVMYFGLSRALSNGQDGMDDMDLEGADDEPEAFLYGPGDFSREIQHSAAEDRWHIPAVDRSHWLCLKHGATVKMTEHVQL